MGRLSNAEAKLKRITEQNRERQARFRENHSGTIKPFNVNLSLERFEQINNALAEKGITKKQFIENAIDEFLKKD